MLCIHCGFITEEDKRHDQFPIECLKEMENFAKFMKAIGESKLNNMKKDGELKESFYSDRMKKYRELYVERDMLKEQLDREIVFKEGITKQLKKSRAENKKLNAKITDWIEKMSITQDKVIPSTSTADQMSSMREINSQIMGELFQKNITELKEVMIAKDKVTNEEHQKLYAKCLENRAFNKKDLSITVTYNGKSKQITIDSTKDRQWRELKSKCMKEFDIPKEKVNAISLLELRCRVRGEQENVKGSIYAGMDINLVPSKFERMTDYSFDATNIKPEGCEPNLTLNTVTDMDTSAQ